MDKRPVKVVLDLGVPKLLPTPVGPDSVERRNWLKVRSTSGPYRVLEGVLVRRRKVAGTRGRRSPGPARGDGATPVPGGATADQEKGPTAAHAGWLRHRRDRRQTSDRSPASGREDLALWPRRGRCWRGWGRRRPGAGRR